MMRKSLVTLALVAAACNNDGVGLTPDMPGAPNDLSSNFDLPGPPADFSTGTDLTGNSDLATAHDLAGADLSSNPDLATPPNDLAVPNDLATNNDLSMPDLSMPDLIPPRDLAVAHDLERPLDFAPPADLATPPADLAALPPPVITATHVGFTGVTCCLVASKQGAVLYLASPSATSTLGTLHLYDGTTDTQLATKVPVGGYTFSPDGTTVLWLAGGTSNSLNLARVATPATRTTLIASSIDNTGITNSFFSPSGKYMLVGVHGSGSQSLDLHIIDIVAGKDAIQYGNGAYDYLEVVAPDDTMYFQNLVGGTSTGMGGVQTLFRVSLPAAATGTAPTSIDTHSSVLGLTPDATVLYYTKTVGGLYAYDTAVGTITTVAATATSFTVGELPGGPVAYLLTDRSVHVLSGGSVVYSSSPGVADPFTPLYLSGDGAHLFYYANVSSQNNVGDLYHVALPPAASNTPKLISTGAALNPLRPVGSRLVFMNNLDQPGQFGDVISSLLDGTGAVKLGSTAPTAELSVLPLKSTTPRVLNLIGASLDPNATLHVSINGSQAITGGLGLTSSLTTAEASIEATTHIGADELSDDTAFALWAGGVSWSATGLAWVGTLNVYDIPAAMGVTGINGVSELTPVHTRSLYVNAPANTTPGVYKVTY
jgi:hypothetical protein